MKHLSALTGLYFFLSITCTAQMKMKKLSDEFVFNSPPFSQCHASTIVEISPGKFMSAAFGGTKEGNKDVCIWLSTMENNAWSEPIKIGEGIINDTLRYPCWNPVLFKIREGKLFLFYKVGPSPSTWWGMVRESTDNGITWTNPVKLPEGILGPIKNKPVQLADGTILSPSSSETGGNWKAHIEKSVDLGKTWQLIQVDPSTPYNVIQPSVLIYPGKRLQILCRSKENSIMQAYSDDNGNTWGAFTKTDLPNPNSGTDALTLKNGQQLLVYNPTIMGKGGRAKLIVATSKDGVKWTEAVVLENHEEGEFSYPAVIQSADGRVHVTYTYNRVNLKHVILEY
jgi:alpha-L-fucosidase